MYYMPKLNENIDVAPCSLMKPHDFFKIAGVNALLLSLQHFAFTEAAL